MSDTVRLYFDERFLDHDAGPGHPEQAARLEAIVRRLRDDPVPGAAWASTRAATREEILRIHHADYLDNLRMLRGRSARLDPDTALSPGSVDAAEHAAGAAVAATEAVLSGEAQRAFALVRPPGHHAECDNGMGFCLLNNIAITAAHAVAALDCRRVLIVDWDVHHGNGTQHAFEAHRNVLFISAHREHFYPGTGHAGETGRGDGEGFTINLPLPRGCDDATHVHLFREVLASVATAYRPDLVLVSAGFDSHEDDPLGGMSMTAAGFAALCGLVREVADEHAGGRLVLVLEGGYDPSALAASVHACTEVLAGSAPPDISEPNGAARRLVDDLRRQRGGHWCPMAR